MTIAAVLVGFAVGLFAYSMLSLAFSEERRVQAQLEQLSSYESAQALVAEPTLAPFSDRIVKPALAWVPRAIKSLAPASYMRMLQRKLLLAGSPRGIDAGRLFTLQAFLAIIMAALMGFGRIAGGQSFWNAMLAALAGGAAAFLLPHVWISMRATSRQEQIRRDLPDMLDMLLISVEAGLGFDAAVAKIVRRAPGPLGEEFGRMLRDGQAGLTRRESLRRLSDRNDVPELNAFIMAMVQADVFGVAISKVLRAQSHELRVKRRQRAEEMAQKAPAKMVFPLILCILPATLIIMGGPAILSIMRAFGGL